MFLRPAAFWTLIPFALLLLTARGCPPTATPQAGAAVSVHQVPLRSGASRVCVIDVNLRAPGVRLHVAAADIARRDGRISGRALTVADWLVRTGAVAGVNGGFFGAPAGEGYLEVVGLLMMDGRVRRSAPTYRARPSGERYARSAFGLTSTGQPRIAWVTSRAGVPQALLAHPAPRLGAGGREWDAVEAVACGPRLVQGGIPTVAYRAERLASPGRLPRTFLGFGGTGTAPQRLVLCAATGMEFGECAEFLTRYFREAHGMKCREGMALDGGGSTQAAWRDGTAIRTDAPLSAPVPTAVVVSTGR